MQRAGPPPGQACAAGHRLPSHRGAGYLVTTWKVEKGARLSRSTSEKLRQREEPSPQRPPVVGGRQGPADWGREGLAGAPLCLGPSGEAKVGLRTLLSS